MSEERLLVICQICDPDAPGIIRTEPIAAFFANQMTYPMDGMNFQAVYPDRGEMCPFLPGQGWEFMSCPRCHVRPFKDRNKIVTTRGVFTIGEEFHPDFDKLTEKELFERLYNEYNPDIPEDTQEGVELHAMFESITRDQLKEKLDTLGIDYRVNDKKDILFDLWREAVKAEGQEGKDGE